MYSLSQTKHILTSRLVKMGMEKSTVLGFILSLKRCFLEDPGINHLQLNQRLQFLGWDDIELDYHTMQLAIACIEAEGF